MKKISPFFPPSAFPIETRAAANAGVNGSFLRAVGLVRDHAILETDRAPLAPYRQSFLKY